MKLLHLTAILLLLNLISNGQSNLEKHKKDRTNIFLNKEELNSLLKNNDFSALFTVTDNSMVYGFIGTNYQRIRVKFISVKKSPSASNTYQVYGKSMVKNTIDIFNGDITITSARLAKKISYGVDDEYKKKDILAEGRLFGTYGFAKDSTQVHAGKFSGIFETDFYIDKSETIHYDD